MWLLMSTRPTANTVRIAATARYAIGMPSWPVTAHCNVAPAAMTVIGAAAEVTMTTRSVIPSRAPASVSATLTGLLLCVRIRATPDMKKCEGEWCRHRRTVTAFATAASVHA